MNKLDKLIIITFKKGGYKYIRFGLLRLYSLERVKKMDKLKENILKTCQYKWTFFYLENIVFWLETAAANTDFIKLSSYYLQYTDTY